MKLIKLPHKNEHILSPWLSLEEAATYCGISRETFRRLQTVLPCPATGGNPTNRRYFAPVVNQWWRAIGKKDCTGIDLGE